MIGSYGFGVKELISRCFSKLWEVRWNLGISAISPGFTSKTTQSCSSTLSSLIWRAC